MTCTDKDCEDQGCPNHYAVEWHGVHDLDGFRSTSYSLPAPTSIGFKDRETGEWVFTTIKETT